MSTKDHIQFDLLSNACDSIRRAVEQLVLDDSWSDGSRLKHAILDCTHCIELLMKEKLRQVNPAFVWENVDKYPSLEARTVTFDTAISRLKNIAGVTFSADDEKVVRSLYKTRNAIQHYEWNTTKKEAKVIVGSALSFAFSFASEELNTDLEKIFKRDDTWQTLIEELYEFLRAHGERLEARLSKKGPYGETCDECGYATVPYFGGSCELCGHWQDTKDDE